MRRESVRLERIDLPLVSLDTLVVGSGAAALGTAVRLHELGRRDVAVVTEAFAGGTSAGAGSDKQTYYKLSLAGDAADSPAAMARDLAAGGCMPGDIALCEALGSAEAFFRLVRLGVPFPHDRFGAYVGYKTDNDPRQRATSAGPLTSRMMFEALAAEIRRRRIPVFDRHPVIGLLAADTDGVRTVLGAVALDLARTGTRRRGFVVFNAANVVLGTGGPAGLYGESVYPESQTGGHGLAFGIGVAGRNLTESQFGMASIKFRWNLSGTYQQVVPRYVSTDRRGRDEREFLREFFPDPGALATAVFLKGYQWPFDPAKAVRGGSSLIDILVHRERALLGRRVFLDYRRNPSGTEAGGGFALDLLGPEAKAYLERSGAFQPTPIERLKHMNPPAVELFRSHGIDLEREPLEIAVCAQHNNGGLAGDIWWQSRVRRLFAVGEVSGTHGVSRPGGSALNSGQVGGLRAALYIAKRAPGRPLPRAEFLALAGGAIRGAWLTAGRMLGAGRTRGAITPEAAGRKIRARMSGCAGMVRDPARVADETARAWALLARLKAGLRVEGPARLADGFKALDLGLTSALYLEALNEYLARGGRSRGSFLVLDPAGEPPCPGLGDAWRFRLADPREPAHLRILEVRLDDEGRVVKTWLETPPVPAPESWFETVWADFRSGRYLEDA